MALVGTTVLSASSAAGFGSGSYTPANTSALTTGQLLVVQASVMEDSGSTDPSTDLSVSGGGLVWTQRAAAGNGSSWSIGTALWTAPVTADGAVSLTFDCAARNIFQYGVIARAYSGHGGTGATASSSSTATDGPDSITLSAAPAASSEIFGGVMQDPTGFAGATPPASGYTELYEFDSGFGSGGQFQVRDPGDTSTSFEWLDIGAGGTLYKGCALAVEIKAAGGIKLLRSNGSNVLYYGRPLRISS